ncbi:CCHC-type domain-containing protein [Trichonephila clavipes]|nr:CCHC-type domain-containing protein [Trichonephila clavipes]
MTENEKVSHLMKGIAEDVYQSLLVKDISCTSNFIKECQRIEEMNQRRISKHRFTILPNVFPVASIGEHEDFATLISHIVREEVQRISVAVNRRNEPPRRPRAFANVVRQPRRSVESLHVPRQTDVWRTDDNRPVCFHCGRPGHVVRYCRERRAIFDVYRSHQATNSQPPSLNLSPDECSRQVIRTPSPIPSSERSPVRRYRSPSPYGRRSPSQSHPPRRGKLSEATFLGGEAAGFSNPPAAAKMSGNHLDVTIDDLPAKLL